ncbi:hypothetical protein NBRC110019_15460 [Neptunitalea chrysea]|uniref:DUF4270 domain-containing protein n=2 Tax=Neptunitalea chrysea TaxID=1647581 RepID=A0A9W6EV53_9FLAO|nr:hypothetical protein NBRC110019_15460 [Neptunitalea chrysea]
MVLSSCKKDFSNLDLPGVSPDFETDVAYFKTYAKNVRLNSVQTDGLSLYQLGKYTSGVYGTEESYIVSQLTLNATSPRFGLYSQEREMADDTLVSTIDEEELVTRVYLDIPYFTNVVLDEEGSAVLDDDDTTTYELDSIYGDSDQEFGIKVQRLTYYLGDYAAPDFTDDEKYYSSNPTPDFLTNYTSDVLADKGDFKISNETIKIYKEDDPDTEDVDESEEIEEVLTPRLRLDLDTAFFQQYIIDQEDNTAFKNVSNFKEYMRGIVINTYDISDNLLMLLDLSEAKITIEYSYTSASENDEGVVEYDTTNTSSFDINLNGNMIQKTTTTDFPSMDTSDDTELIYLKGVQGSMAQIDLLDATDLETMRDENWLINEANLTFYVDRDDLDGNGVIEPNRIFLFNLDEEGIPLMDYAFDPTATSVAYSSRYVHGGIIEKDDDDDAVKYKIRLTEHLNNIVRNDSVNVSLGLVVLSDINAVTTSTVRTVSEEEVIIPAGSTTNPSGTILYGSSATVPEDKRLRLEVFYTKPSN